MSRPPLNGVALTMDLDWAPDWAIEEAIHTCKRAEIPTTIFVTHDSPFIESLKNDPLFELGIHPNFLQGSSHGSSMGAALEFCLKLVPDASSMRTHSLVQSSQLFNLIGDNFSMIETDVSLLLPLHPSLRGTDIYVGKQQRRLSRLPYFWEDDTLAAFPNWDWSDPIPQGDGIRIFDFHPTFLSLNLADIGTYSRFKAAVGSRPFQSLSKDDFAPFINRKNGSRTALETLIAKTPVSAFCQISNLTYLYRELDQ